MKKNVFYFGGLLVVSAILFIFASCTQEDDFIVDNCLDIDSQVPLTRSGGGDDGGPAAIPNVEDQCGPWATTKVAYNKGVRMPTGNMKPDGSPEIARVGSDKYSCSRYYDEINTIHENRTWHYCDSVGQVITGPGAGTYQGSPTEMYPSALKSIGQELGALTGNQNYYNTFAELKQYLLDHNLESGTYIIFNPRTGGRGHYYVGKGVARYGQDKGKILLEDATGGGYTISEADNPQEGEKKGFVLIY